MIYSPSNSIIYHILLPTFLIFHSTVIFSNYVSFLSFICVFIFLLIFCLSTSLLIFHPLLIYLSSQVNEKRNLFKLTTFLIIRNCGNLKPLNAQREGGTGKQTKKKKMRLSVKSNPGVLQSVQRCHK